MNLLKYALKILIAAIILWVVWGRFDADQFRLVLTNPILLCVIPICWFFNQVLTTLRLQSILHSLGRPTQLFDVFRANMSSLFVGNLMPGVMGADVVKFFYIKKHDPSISKTQLALVLVLDRILGLVAILFWCTIFSIFIMTNYSNDYSEMAEILVYLPLVLFILFIIGLLILDYLMKFLTKFKLPDIFLKLVNTYHMLVQSGNRRALILVLVYNLLAVFILLTGLVFVGVYLQTQETGQGMFALQFFLIPLALIVSMLPLTPMGIGVAQITLASAYGLFGLSESVGFSISTLSQLGLLMISVLIGGAYFLIGTFQVRKTV